MLPRSLLRYLVASALVVLGSVIGCSPESPVGSGSPYSNPTTDCFSDADCSGGKPVCDPLRGCVACQFDSQCDEGERCVERACEALVTCSQAGDCAGTNTPACDRGTGTCEQCLLDGDCGAGERCVAKRCQAATACTNSRDCGDDRVCDRASGWCVTCLSSADCDEESTCVDNACVSRCSSDKDCTGQNLLCNVDGGHCVECVAHVDCPTSYHCAAGTCEIDVCERGAGRCDPFQNAALGCNQEGSDFVPVLCPTGTSCSEEEKSASCAPWTCEPFSAQCSADGSTLRVCAEDGLGYSQEVDCTAEGGTCEGTACVDVVCEPEGLECMGASVVRCNVNGTSFSVTTTCSQVQYCDNESATCQFDVCLQGQDVCDGNVARTCNADGSGFEGEGTDCSATGETCFQGQCLPQVCEDGIRHCWQGNVYSCLDAGTQRFVWDTCSASQYCDHSGEHALCRTRSCTTGQVYCDGEVAGTCNAEGSGQVPGTTTDCAALDGKACYLGQCLDKVCPGQFGCDGGHAHFCSANGTAFGSRSSTCASTQHCVENERYCQTDVCTQGLPACDGNVATTCNADGSGYEPGGTDCGEGQLCVSGTCLPIVCEKNTYYCSEGNLYLCGADGTTSALHDTCTPEEYCAPGYSSCRADVCTYGAPYCNGELVSTCNEEGSGAEEGGTACPSGETCEGGGCVPTVCEPDELLCVGNNVERCNARGTAWSRATTCGTARFCDDSGETAVCVDDICGAEQLSCDGETLAVCDAYGGGYSGHTTDCSVTGQVCSGSACVEQDVVVVGEGTSSYSMSSSYGYFHVYRVTSSRSLTSIEQMFSVSGTSQFTWYVYEHSAATGNYTKIFEKLTTSSGTAVYHGSGAIDVPLSAGKHYLIGVRVNGGHSYFVSTGTSPDWVSFGAFRTNRGLSSVPGATFNVSTTIQSTQYAQRLTTEAL